MIALMFLKGFIEISFCDINMKSYCIYFSEYERPGMSAITKLDAVDTFLRLGDSCNAM